LGLVAQPAMETATMAMSGRVNERFMRRTFPWKLDL
jgi:hypothetical protein